MQSLAQVRNKLFLAWPLRKLGRGRKQKSKKILCQYPRFNPRTPKPTWESPKLWKKSQISLFGKKCVKRKSTLCLGADFKNNQTTKQLNNSIWTNRKQVKFCFYLPIGPNKNCLIVFKIRSLEKQGVNLREGENAPSVSHAQGDIDYMDVVGPISPKINSAKYLLTMMGGFSLLVMVSPSRARAPRRWAQRCWTPGWKGQEGVRCFLFMLSLTEVQKSWASAFL